MKIAHFAFKLEVIIILAPKLIVYENHIVNFIIYCRSALLSSN